MLAVSGFNGLMGCTDTAKALLACEGMGLDLYLCIEHVLLTCRQHTAYI